VAPPGRAESQRIWTKVDGAALDAGAVTARSTVAIVSKTATSRRDLMFLLLGLLLKAELLLC
jgi:hypothetical protein